MEEQHSREKGQEGRRRRQGKEDIERGREWGKGGNTRRVAGEERTGG